MSERESNLVSHARRELQILETLASHDVGDPAGSLEMQKLMTADVLKVVAVIASTGQSGGSIGYFLSLIQRCASYQNLAPLQGTDDEWFYHGVDMGNMYQNVRNGAVFKDGADTQAYYLDGYVTVDPDGGTYNSVDSGKCYINFPYTPVVNYVPRFELLREDETFMLQVGRPELISENYLFDTADAVLDFYFANGISQPVDVTSDVPEAVSAVFNTERPVGDAVRDDTK